jgi:hypothetical protein
VGLLYTLNSFSLDLVKVTLVCGQTAVKPVSTRFVWGEFNWNRHDARTGVSTCLAKPLLGRAAALAPRPASSGHGGSFDMSCDSAAIYNVCELRLPRHRTCTTQSYTSYQCIYSPLLWMPRATAVLKMTHDEIRAAVWLSAADEP